MALSQYPGSSSKSASNPNFIEFEILKASHKFLREEDRDGDTNESWNEKLAAKYYASLYREFAVCDLKHYKSGNFALRWRTEDEVLSGAGETTCGNTRCVHHSKEHDRTPPILTTLELPFAYVEHGESKSALVKVVLCTRCVKKLMWKRRNKESGEGNEDDVKQEERGNSEDLKLDDRKKKRRESRGGRHGQLEEGTSSKHRKRDPRSLSPSRTSVKPQLSPTHLE